MVPTRVLLLVFLTIYRSIVQSKVSVRGVLSRVTVKGRLMMASASSQASRTTGGEAPPISISGVQFDNRNLRELPVDPMTGNSIRTVKDSVFSRVAPTPVQGPTLVSVSPEALSLLGVANPDTEAAREELARFLGGNEVLKGSDPAAHCYCGHQFGNFAGQLGDGAAISLGEVMSATDGARWELQLKGAGPTPYSRSADGRKVLRSSIREYLMSESMHFLGIPTTRAATLVTSKSTVVRDPMYDGTRLKEPCTIVSRLAPNFFRFGSFEIFKTHEGGPGGRAGPSAGNTVLHKQLLEYVIRHYYPDIFAIKDEKQRVRSFFAEVVQRTARLVAAWDGIGWVHGVLNTDNMSIMGLTIDYGPYGFVESFDPEFTPNGSDGTARYAYKHQAAMCRWNCKKLAEALRPFLDEDDVESLLAVSFDAVYEEEHMTWMRGKLGLSVADATGDENFDADLIDGLFSTMALTNADFTDTFLALAAFATGDADRATTLERLLSRCAAPSEVAKQLERKGRIMRLSMHPQQIQQLWAMLQEAPQRVVEMFGGAPLEAIENEIGGEKRKLDSLMNLSQTMATLETTPAKDKKDKDASSWNAWLDRYSSRLASEGHTSTLADARRALTAARNPTFVLRNWVAQDTIEAAERGDYSKVNTVLGMLRRPYDAALNPFATSQDGAVSAEERAFIGLGPDWAASLICTCSS